MSEVIVPIEKKAKKIGNTTVSGGGDAVVQGSSDKKSSLLVGARDYTSSKGYSGIVDWDGENVLVGGTAVKPEYVTNGIAYVNKSNIDNALSDFEERNGIIGNDKVLDLYNKKYDNKISDALKKVTNRESFSYDPDDDPVYNAYKEKYERLAEDAYRRVLNDNNTSVTGASGAVLSEALASRDEYLKELSDMIPELAENAYDRYSGETQRLENNLKLISDVADSYYDKVYKSNRDAIDDVTLAGERERAEKQRWIENERTDTNDRLEYERNLINDAYDHSLISAELSKLAAELSYYPRKTESELESTRLKNEETALDNAVTRGFFVETDERSLPWLAEFKTNTGYSINPQTALAAFEYNKSYSKQRGTINAKLGL